MTSADRIIRLANLRAARRKAYAAVKDAQARRDSRGYHDALKRLVTATHAVMQAEAGR